MPECRTRALLAIVLASTVGVGLLDANRLRAATQAPAGQATTSAAGFAAPTSSVDERLAAVRVELFSRPERLPAAVKELHAILAIAPESAMAHVLLGLAHVQGGSPDMLAEAVAEFRQAIALEPGLTPARFYLARTYLDLSQLERARDEMLEALTRLPDQPQFLALLAESERRLGQTARAIEVAHRALAIDPAFGQARYYLSLTLLDAGRRDDAIQQLEHLGRTDTQNAAVFGSLGHAYLDAGRVDDAMAALTRSVSLAPPRPDVRVRLARAYRLKGLLEQADQELTLAFPPHASIQVSAEYQQLEVTFNLERGLVRLLRGQLDPAIESFTRALDMNPDSAPVHRALADAYKKKGLSRQAAEHAAKADGLEAAKSPR